VLIEATPSGSETDCPHDQSLGRRRGSNIGSMSNEKKKRRKKIFQSIECHHTI